VPEPKSHFKLAKKAGPSLPNGRVFLYYVFNLVRLRPQAKYVVFFAFDGYWDSLDMADAWHPQTLLLYGMNGQTLPTPHGAPVRLRVPRQLAYKSREYLSRIMITDTVKTSVKGWAPRLRKSVTPGGTPASDAEFARRIDSIISLPAELLSRQLAPFLFSIRDGVNPQTLSQKERRPLQCVWLPKPNQVDVSRRIGD
jgi:hypothetical protein